MVRALGPAARAPGRRLVIAQVARLNPADAARYGPGGLFGIPITPDPEIPVGFARVDTTGDQLLPLDRLGIEFRGGRFGLVLKQPMRDED